MTDEFDQQNQELVPYEEGGSESLSEVIKPLVPVMTQFLDHQLQISQQQTELQRQQLDLAKTQAAGNLEFAKERLKLEDKKQGRQFWTAIFLLFPIVLVALAAGVGLIFVKDNVSAGIFLLSHLIAFAVGIIGGVGWQRANKDAERKTN
jgi:cation transport ATPase